MAESVVQVTEGSGKKLHTYQRTIGANSVEDEVTINGEHYLAHYSVSPPTASTATANSHLLQIMAGASLGVYIRSIEVWQSGLATVAAIDEIHLFRLTSAGTGGTAVTPQQFDQGDGASGATAMVLPTVKGTESGNSFLKATAQFTQTVATQGPGANAQLLCRFDFDTLRGKGLRIVAGTTNGIAVKNPTARAGATVLVIVRFSEANFS